MTMMDHSQVAPRSDGEITRPANWMFAPWVCNFSEGSGWTIKATLPAGFKIDATYRGTDGGKKYTVWQVTDPQPVLIATELWVQFATAEWSKMQERFAHLIAAAPELFSALQNAARILADYAADAEEPTVFDALQVAEAALAHAQGQTP